MATPPPLFANVDWTQYQAWPNVTVDGLPYKSVPGSPAVNGKPLYVYDPGQNKYLYNGEVIRSQQQDVAKKNSPGLLQQIGPGLAGTAGTLGGIWGINHLLNSGSAATAAAPTVAAAAPGAAAAGAVGAQSIGGVAGGAASQQAAANIGLLAPASTSAAAAPATALAAPEIVGANAVPAGTATLGAPTTILGSETLGTALPIAGAALGTYGVYKGFENKSPVQGALSGAAAGASLGTLFPIPGVGTIGGALIGAGIGGLAGFAGKLEGGKGHDHMLRSKMRDQLAQSGFALRTSDLGGNIDPGQVKNSTGTFVPLANGSFYDISGEKGASNYNVEQPDNKWSGQSISWANPIANIITGGDHHLRTQFAGYLTNAIMSNSPDDIEGIRSNAQAVFKQLGMTPEQAKAQLQALVAANKIDQQEANVGAQGIDTLLNGGNYYVGSLHDGEASMGKPLSATPTTGQESMMPYQQTAQTQMTPAPTQQMQTTQPRTSSGSSSSSSSPPKITNVKPDTIKKVQQNLPMVNTRTQTTPQPTGSPIMGAPLSNRRVIQY